LKWPDLPTQIEFASGLIEPSGSLSLLSTLGLSVQAWQDARGELGDKPWRFEASEITYISARNTIVAHLMAWFSYLVVPRASGSAGPTIPSKVANGVRLLIEQARQLAVPNDLAEALVPPKLIAARAGQEILRIATAVPELSSLSVLLDPLKDLVHAPPTDPGSISLKDEPDKAATIYATENETVRGQQAGEAVDTILKVAAPLAAKHGESLDDGAIRGHPLVILLSRGIWANRVSVLAAARYALEKLTPRTASRMKDRQSFRELDDWRTLWRKFEELGELPKALVPARPKPRFDILGSSWTQEEFDDSAASGPTGELARRVLDAVLLDLNLASLRGKPRARVQAKVGRSGGGAGGTGVPPRPPDEHLRMLGAVGEHFVFEQMKAVLPDWDLTNWRSKAREVFGYGAGDDTLGYDFECADVGGKLTGRLNSPRCLIEVKSTASECGDTFEMSINEWEVAVACHACPSNAVYVIIRVAGTASKPQIVDVLVDPVALHLQGVLYYSSRHLLIALGKPTTAG
jgi:hypothetical protein